MKIQAELITWFWCGVSLFEPTEGKIERKICLCFVAMKLDKGPSSIEITCKNTVKIYTCKRDSLEKMICDFRCSCWNVHSDRDNKIRHLPTVKSYSNEIIVYWECVLVHAKMKTIQSKSDPWHVHVSFHFI